MAGERGDIPIFLGFDNCNSDSSTHIPLENVGIACAHTAALVLIVVGRGGGASAGALLAAPTTSADSRHQFPALHSYTARARQPTVDAGSPAARTPAL